MTGANNAHAEFTIGLRCMDNDGHYFYPETPPGGAAESEKNQLSFFPNVSIGFRYQKPGGHLLLRTSFGIPFLQVSLGYQF